MTTYKLDGQKVKSFPELKEKVNTFIPAEDNDYYTSDIADMPAFLEKLKERGIEYKIYKEYGISMVLFEGRRMVAGEIMPTVYSWCKRFK